MATTLPFQLNTQQGEGSYLRQQFPKIYGALAGLLGTDPNDVEGSVLDPNTAAVKSGAEMSYLPGLLTGAMPLGKAGAGLGLLAGAVKGVGRAEDALGAVKAARMSRAESEAAGYWHSIGDGKRLPIPVAQMTSEKTVMGGLTPKIMRSPEEMQGGSLVSLVGDRSQAGVLLDGVGGACVP